MGYDVCVCVLWLYCVVLLPPCVGTRDPVSGEPAGAGGGGGRWRGRRGDEARYGKTTLVVGYGPVERLRVRTS